MKPTTFADWMKYHPRPHELDTNKEENLFRIISWGLYTLPHLFINSNDVDEDKVINFCRKLIDKKFLVRVLPISGGVNRTTWLNLTNSDSVLEIMKVFLPLEENYIFFLAAYSQRSFVGNIIVSDKGNVIIEIMQNSDHPIITCGTAKVVLDYRSNNEFNENQLNTDDVLFISGINWEGRINHHFQTPSEVKWIAYLALKKIRITRGVYLSGYYEFAYSKLDGLSFIDAIFEKNYILDWEG